MASYTLGIDFGTLSARAIVVDAATGEVRGSASMDYPHGVMDQRLPDGTPLKPDWALQHPGDWTECLSHVVPEAIGQAGVDPAEVTGLGIDCTSCTVLPVDAGNVPLCLKPGFSSVPHAWPMLWKHHAAQPFATRMTDIARARGEAFLDRYGGRVSSEWLFPRLWQVLEEAPGVYAAARRFVDAGDWIVSRLTGALRPSACIAGYKGFYHPLRGWPSRDYLRALDPRLENVAGEKLPDTVYPLGAKAGTLASDAARALGLPEGVAVAVANIDAHAAVPGAGLDRPGDLLLILGTSGCHMLLGDGESPVPGICGAVMDGFIPGLCGFEAGQTCLGDHFSWAAERIAPESVARAARAHGTSVQAELSTMAASLRPGESGLLALDWWNGNRSVLVDAGLSGLILGLTLATRPEEIFRALIEATAFGLRTIVENFESHGQPVRHIAACGGIAVKNPLVMKIYSSVLNREIEVAASDQASALGAAMFGAVAAGVHPDIRAAVRRMTRPGDTVFHPDTRDAETYDQLFAEYTQLHDYFGRGGSDVMHRLRALRDGCRT